MTSGKSATKVVLLIQPTRLLYRHPVLQLLKITRSAKGLDMDELPLSPGLIKLHLKNAPAPVSAALQKLSGPELEKLDMAITLQHRRHREAKPFEDYRREAWIRHYQQNLGLIKQFTEVVSFYHRLPEASTNKIRTAPCHYYPYTVNLFVELDRGQEGLVMRVMVEKGKERLPIGEFRRFYFLLERNNEYLHLSLKAFEALEWLEEQDQEFARSDESAFVHRVAGKLRELGQQVNTDKLLPKQAINALPAPRVMLSELNNAFLMLTPQYVYDGHVIDSAWEPVTEIQVHGKPALVHRHAETEEQLTGFLRGLHPNFSRQLNGYFYLSFADAQKKGWFLSVYHKLLELDIELLGMDMLRHFKYSPHKAETSMEMAGEEGDWLQIQMSVRFGKEEVPLHELQKMLLNGQKAVLLKDGSLGVLGEDWLRQYGSIIKHSRVKKKELLAPRWLAMGQEAEAGEVQQLMHHTIAPEWWSRWRQWQQPDGQLYPLPASLAITTLRPYQQKGYEWIRLLAEAGGSACLADDMGLGKTLQAMAFLLHRIEENPDAKHLVICPTSLIYNWQQELQKFAPAARAFVYHGTQRNTDMLIGADQGIIITSYGTMRQDVDVLSAIAFDTIVLDESHHIKNPSAQITQAVMQLSARTRIALSGTPIMNGTGDLYSQFQFLLPGLLGSREFFRREYAHPIEQQGDKEKAAALQKIINPFVLRRTKEQAAPDLPEKTESILWCEMGHDQRMAYESIRKNIRSSVFLEIEQKGLNQGKLAVMAGLMKLRQVCNSAEMVKGEDLFCTDSIKTRLLVEELGNIVPQHKALVFSQFTSMLDLLERDLRQAGLPLLRLDGQTRAGDRQDLVNQFQQEDGEAKVFLISLKAGNAGLNLTAADYVFLFDPWWNVAVENQAIDRTHRIGQQSQVFAYRMICKNSIEEKIIRMSERKKLVAEDLVTAEESFVKSLTMEDVAYLLQ